MSRRVGTRGRASRKPVIVIAGEDANDRKSLRAVLESHCPDTRGRTVEINDSVRLARAEDATLKKRVDVLCRKAEARAERESSPLACIFVHEDWDAVDSDRRLEVRSRVQRTLGGRSTAGHYVLAAWEIEAWLLLFPAALRKVSPAWRIPAAYRGRDTGVLNDPKRILVDECSGRSRRYQERDAPTVIERAVEGRSHVGAGFATNRSWDDFLSEADRCCTEHS